MSVALPKPIADYFTADAGGNDRGAVARCFTENAVVRDEGRVHAGRAAIQEWKERSAAKYRYTAEPFKAEAIGGKTVVTSHLVGNFPGSPVDLRYFFELDGDKIASLEIIP